MESILSFWVACQQVEDSLAQRVLWIIKKLELDKSTIKNFKFQKLIFLFTKNMIGEAIPNEVPSTNQG